MKKILSIILLLAFVSTSYAIDVRTISGKVICNDIGVANVVVSDGETFAKTNADGSYSMTINTESRFVFISTPSGYDAPIKNNVIQFYNKLEAEKSSYDFVLSKKKVDDKNHAFVVMADPQIWHEKEFPMLAEAMKDIRTTVKNFNNIPVHGICCGDIVSHDHNFYPRYNNVVAESGVKFFNVIGNHDMVCYGRSFETTQSKFEQMYGPTYYSFNIGKVHYVVLNDNFYIGRDWFYIGYINEKQLRWLEKDLSYIPEGARVVLCMHIPSTCSEADRKQFRYERSGSTLVNHRGLYQILKPYNTLILSGHTHAAYNQQIDKNIFEHVLPAISGAWWQSLFCSDGTPHGYSVFEVNGDKIEWYYKSVGEDKNHQMRVYSGKDYPEFDGYIVANIWNFDDSWKVEIYEDGVNKGAMEQFETTDPIAKRELANNENFDHKYAAAAPTEHFFRAKLSNSAKKIEVVATDRFGNIYKSEINNKK